MKATSDQIIVYTALMGGYEALVEQPVAARSRARFICFTDNPDLVSETWEVRQVVPTIAGDSTRAARKLKILGNDVTRAADVSIWIDNRVVLRQLPEDLLPTLLGDSDLGIQTHSYRNTVQEEFEAVLSAGFDHPWRVREQLQAMKEHAPETLLLKPYWTAILFRRNSEELSRTMEIWYEMVMRYSRRDQLSINYAISRSNNLKIQANDVDNNGSNWHKWLAGTELQKDKATVLNRKFQYTVRRHVGDALLGNRVSLAVRTRWQAMLNGDHFLLKVGVRVGHASTADADDKYKFGNSPR